MTELPRKMRTRGHVLADLSINHVERQVLRCGFSADRVQYDYGYDLTMATYSDSGEFEPVRSTSRSRRPIGCRSSLTVGRSLGRSPGATSSSGSRRLIP